MTNLITKNAPIPKIANVIIHLKIIERIRLIITKAITALAVVPIPKDDAIPLMLFDIVSYDILLFKKNDRILRIRLTNKSCMLINPIFQRSYFVFDNIHSINIMCNISSIINHIHYNMTVFL